MLELIELVGRIILIYDGQRNNQKNKKGLFDNMQLRTLKAMICQPMFDPNLGKCLDEAEIKARRDAATEFLIKQGYEVVNTFFEGEEYSDAYLVQVKEIRNIPTYFIAKSLEKMSECSVVYFLKGWASARGCHVEHTVAELYGIPILYEQ